jgi:putative ABC transport system permease protein
VFSRVLAPAGAFFEVLDVMPQLGRGFRATEERAGNDRVNVLSHGLWQRRFGGAPAIVGSRIVLDQESYEVVGVLPRSFGLGDPPADVFYPL